MSRLPDKQSIFSLSRSGLWAIALVSATLFASVMVAIPLLPKSKSVKSSAAIPSLQPSPQNFSENLLAEAEREWHYRVVSQSLSLPRRSITDTSTTTSHLPTPKTQTPQLSQIIARNPTSKSLETKSQQTDSSSRTIQRKTPTLQPSETVPLLDMRVAIAKGVSTLSVATSTPGQILDVSGKVLGQLPAKTRTNIQIREQSILFGEIQLPQTVWLNPSQEGLTLVGDRWYRGNVLLTVEKDNLLAVNYVNLEAYLESVVGAEMPANWPMEALKAQAIAARSYALVHSFRPANPLYDLGDSQRWQVYKGVNSEWNTTTQAVSETTGMFLSYQGGVVESMYAATDEIVAKVFEGQGMSQTGAKNLAQQGYNYLEILDTYYPGAGLALIETVEPQTN
ncbi:MAG: SpoIID/LytB domain-containing protein [Symploca sp. SIO2C1]|nr:SpoIID/LytB domain-containing protein [Symploca sp. SIO2C1]